MKKLFPRGAQPTPQSVIDAIPEYKLDVSVPVPSSYLIWPIQMSYWGNDKYGDCVSAEEAFAKSAANPHIFISDDTLIGWARRHEYLNGATLVAVLKTMKDEGLEISFNTVFDGNYKWISFRDSEIMKSAIVNNGPVKLGVGAGKFEGGKAPVHGKVTPGKSGWTMYNYPTGVQMDHCVSICGYGPLAELIAKFKENGVKVKVQKGMPETMCYAMFTWNSIGIIDEQSMINMTREAWVREPVTPPVSFQKVSSLQLENDGGFVVDIHALYRDPNSIIVNETANRSNFPIGKTKTMNLEEKCTSPPINVGDIVQMKVWVEAGKDNICPIVFVYDPNGPTQSFKISGSTLNNSLQYIGPC